jgi:hypothetical protein
MYDFIVSQGQEESTKDKTSNNPKHKMITEPPAEKMPWNHQLGFIAQDIKNTKVGDLVVVKGENGELGYINNSYINIIAGALQYEINLKDKQISELEKRITILEKMLNK